MRQNGSGLDMRNLSLRCKKDVIKIYQGIIVETDRIKFQSMLHRAS